MRSRGGVGVGVAVFAVGLSSASAQVPPPAAAPPAPAATGAPAPPAGGPAQPQPTPGATDAGAATKAPSSTGGYSWRDRPARRASRKKRDPNAALAMFPAFRMVGKASQLRVAFTKPVRVEVRRAAGRVVFFVPGADVAVRNDTNALVVTHFDTPLSRFRMAPRKEGVELWLELRESVELRHRLVEGPRGTSTLIIDVPPPTRSWTAELEEPEAAAPAAGPSRRPKRARGTLVTPGAARGPRP
ncbi:MAG: hypothetical protein IT376_22670 [Polyangiaceae bacterium]|nr:hypothetical protein [Polyangiaceae bacterium]